MITWGCSQINAYVNTDANSDNQAQTQQHASEPEAAPSYVDVWLDGQQAKKQSSGMFRITKPISVGPKLRYEINDKTKFGNVNSTIINIFPSTGSGWSTKTAFIVLVTGGEKKMLPGKEYNLGAGDGGMMIMDGDNKTVSGVTLKSGKKYLMNFVVSADQSETVGIEFTTR